MKLQKTHQEMDRISILPQDIIGKVLTLMPIRDALRTSVLSKKWRYCWTAMPRLEFHVIKTPFALEEFNRHKLFKGIFHVLMLHKGPLLEFSMCINNKEIANEIDPIILHLLRSNNLKKFDFEDRSRCYKLPSSFFSLQGLEHLDLDGCVIEPPLNFIGFSMLRSLALHDCLVTSKMLHQFLTNCPLLEEFYMGSCSCNASLDVEENNCTFVELFKCLPSVQILGFYSLDIQNFAKGDMPQKLPTPLVHLRILDFDVRLQHDDLSFVLRVINNSPNLENLILEIYPDHVNSVQQEANDLLDLQDYSDLSLDKLEQLVIINFHNLPREIGFVKLLMAKSPVLKKAQMKLSKHVSVEEEVKMLRDLVQLPFPRASPTANFIIKR